MNQSNEPSSVHESPSKPEQKETNAPRKLLLWIVFAVLLVLVGAYAVMTQRAQDRTASVVPEPSVELSETYTDQGYGFGFNHPADFAVRERPEGKRAQQYLGMETSFFASLRDMEREEKPVSVAFFYAVPDLSVETFTQAVNDDESVGEVTSTESMTINGLEVTKVVNTTPLDIDKVHYLFIVDDTTIVTSVFLDEEEAFEPILQTLHTAQ